MTETNHSHTRDLLRHLDDPGSLQGNQFAARWLALGADVWACTRAAIAQLPEPLRTIVTRCDLAKELHTVVAADIGVSERHFYRLRRKALLCLTDAGSVWWTLSA
jgi:DNA-directed RNA polymerase specialized sigma24 family protein